MSVDDPRQICRKTSYRAGEANGPGALQFPLSRKALPPKSLFGGVVDHRDDTKNVGWLQEWFRAQIAQQLASRCD